VNAISSLAPERHGTGVLAATQYGNRTTGRAAATIDLFAPRPDGLLTRVRRLACAHAPGCQIPLNFNSAVLALTPDGDTLYYAAFYSGLAALRVRPHRLTTLPGHAACIVARGHYMPPLRCARAGHEIANDMAISPDGRNLYVGFIGTSPRGNFYSGGIETFTIRR